MVIAIDAGQDSKYTFEDLGNAIRKCYTDFGIRIEVPNMEADFGINPNTKMSNKHFSIGEINYKDGGFKIQVQQGKVDLPSKS